MNKISTVLLFAAIAVTACSKSETNSLEPQKEDVTARLDTSYQGVTAEGKRAPGVRYYITTTCGYETTLVVAANTPRSYLIEGIIKVNEQYCGVKPRFTIIND